MDVRPVDIHVRIDELVVHGIEAHAAPEVSQSVRRELARLLSQGNLPRSLLRSGQTRSIDVRGDLPPARPAPSATGKGIARSIYGGLQG